MNERVYKYALKDHLGNTRVVFSDRNDDGVVGVADIEQINNYYPFGMNMDGPWNGANGADKYQFSGKELSSEFGLNWQYYGARFYDPIVGRWWSKDPLSEMLAGSTVYNFVSNNPVAFVDIAGMYKYPAGKAQAYAGKYKKLTKFLDGGGIQDFLAKKDIRMGLKIIGFYTEAQIDQELAVFGKGPEITIEHLADADPTGRTELNGVTYYDKFSIEERLAQQLEDASNSADEQAALLIIVSNILHETTHVGFNSNNPNGSLDLKVGDWERKIKLNVLPQDGYKPYVLGYYYKGKAVGHSGETGDAFEQAIWGTGQNKPNKQGSLGIDFYKALIKDKFPDIIYHPQCKGCEGPPNPHPKAPTDE